MANLVPDGWLFSDLKSNKLSTTQPDSIAEIYAAQEDELKQLKQMEQAKS